MSKARDNHYRVWQKTHGAGSKQGTMQSRINATLKTTHYYQASMNRLFICYGEEQAAELKKLCGKSVKHMTLTTVALRRLHDPFREEINLKPATP